LWIFVRIKWVKNSLSAQKLIINKTSSLKIAPFHTLWLRAGLVHTGDEISD